MKKLRDCDIDNCIPTPSSCTDWNGGDIEYLGICNGDPLNNVVIEIITKLQDIAGEDLSSFDIDLLIDICNQKQPIEINLTSILILIRDNQVCLKDYIDTLNDKINELSLVSGVDVNLKCFADFDNLGNALSVTRATLDQLVIDELCNHGSRLETAEGKITNLQNQVNAIDISPQAEELSFATCLDATILPTSSQVITTAQEVCDIEDAIGTPAQVATALAKTAGDVNTEFGLITGWNLAPANWAQNYGNLLLEVENLRQRIIFMEDNCCQATCDDVKVGFSAVLSDDQTTITLRFISGAGTSIPTGFTDAGSTVSVTDIDGNVIDMDITIANNAEIDVDITGLNVYGDLDVNVTVKMSNGVTICEKCVFRKVTVPACSFCVITASDTVTIIYEITI